MPLEKCFHFLTNIDCSGRVLESRRCNTCWGVRRRDLMCKAKLSFAQFGSQGSEFRDNLCEGDEIRCESRRTADLGASLGHRHKCENEMRRNIQYFGRAIRVADNGLDDESDLR